MLRLVCFAVVSLAACCGLPCVHAADLAGFKLDGQQFAFEHNGLAFKGILLKPEGAGPFPAVLISHGLGSAAEGFGMQKAREMVKWGFVCIAPTYTHTGEGMRPGMKGAPQKGAPQKGPANKAGADRKDFGASDENLKRAEKCLEILASLPYVDRQRLFAYGNSMGAFVTIGLAARVPDKLKAAAITAGGLSAQAGYPAPTPADAAKVRTPFLILHGDPDGVVPTERSALLKAELDKNKVPNERQLFPGADHQLHQVEAEKVYGLIKAWFEKHGAARK